MKKTTAVVFFGLIMAQFSWAQNSTTTTTSEVAPEQTKKWSVYLEMESNTTKDSQDEIDGSETLFTVEPGYDIDDKQTISAGANYYVRTYDEQSSDSQDRIDRKERDYLNEAYVNYDYKYSALGFNNKFRGSYVYNADPLFRGDYGNVGNVQLRNYFGRNIKGAFFVDRANSYVRYQQYIANSFKTDASRDYEVRFRVTPAYQFTSDFKAGLTLTYNYYRYFGEFSQENIEVGASARYAFLKDTAVILMADFVPFESAATGGSMRNSDGGIEQTVYRVNLSTSL